MPTGPKCNSHPRGGQQNAAPFHRGVRANKVRTEPSVARLGPNQKFSSGDQRERIDESLSPSFAPLGLLPLERGDQPIQSKQKDRKSTRLNSSHRTISYAVFCLKKKR